jgi:hypothetical protein
MLNKIKLNNLNKYYKINIINLLLKNKFNKKNIVIFIINLFFDNRVDYLFLLNNNNLNKINVNLYNYLILFFNDFNFNVNNFSMCSPLFTLKLYHEIKQSNNFNIIYTKNFNKLLNINFNTITDSFYKLNILTKLSTSLSLTHKNLKLFDTNYI